MNVNRDIYLQRLIDSRHNHMIKVITGVRRCGKSYLLFHLFADWLLADGIPEDHIISVNYIQSAYKMDTDEKRRQECLSLSKVDDSFKKIVIVADDQLVHHDDHGITTICLKDFLTHPQALEL